MTAAAPIALALRIGREEETLARTFPDYLSYATTTKRGVLFVY